MQYGQKYIDIGYPPWPGELCPGCSWDPRPRLRGWWWWLTLAQLSRLSRHISSQGTSVCTVCCPPPVTGELQLLVIWGGRSWVVVPGCIGIGSGGDTWPCSFLAPPALWRIAITRRTAPWDSGQPLHEEATLKLQSANKGEAGVHLLNSGSFHSSGTSGSQFECLNMLFGCCCVVHVWQCSILMIMTNGPRPLHLHLLTTALLWHQRPTNFSCDSDFCTSRLCRRNFVSFHDLIWCPQVLEYKTMLKLRLIKTNRGG